MHLGVKLGSFIFSHILLILLKYHISLHLGTPTDFYFYFALEQHLSLLCLTMKSESPNYNTVDAEGVVTVIYLHSFGLYYS